MEFKSISIIRSLVICEFTSTQKGQFQISWKHQLQVHTPEQELRKESLWLQELPGVGMNGTKGKQPGTACDSSLPSNSYRWRAPVLSLWGWLMQASPQLLLFWMKNVWTGNPGNCLGKSGAWALKCLLWQHRTNPAELESHVPTPHLPWLWILLSAAGSSPHLNRVLRAQPRVRHVLGASKYCGGSDSRSPSIPSGTHVTELHSTGGDSEASTADS